MGSVLLFKRNIVMEICVKYLPLITVSLLVLTIIVTFCLSLRKDHVIGSLPYISDTGTKSPESCIFGQVLNILWVLLSFVVYVKYRQVKDILNRYNIQNRKLLNRTTMQIGLGAAFGISIVANFQETNLFYIHWCGTILALGLGAIYQCMQTALYKDLVKIIGQRKITSLRMVLSVISVTTFFILLICAIIAYQEKKNENDIHWPSEDGGSISHIISVMFAWICTASTTLYVTLFYWEFKKITLYEPDVFVEDKITIDLNMAKTNEGFQDA